MLDDLFEVSRHFLKLYNRVYKRAFVQSHSLSNRCSIIVGQRGIGKSTAMIQFLLKDHAVTDETILYVPVDHFKVNRYAMFDMAEAFYQRGGKFICFDEIHKYINWSQELKSIYDSFPSLKVLASGSSALEIYKGSHDLSRRAMIYKMYGLSFREYLELTLNEKLPVVKFESLLGGHVEFADQILDLISKKGEKILALFHQYLKEGYYPYFYEFEERELFYLTLEQNVHATIESDLATIYPSLKGSSLNKIKKLLSFIASSVPFVPDFHALKKIIDVGDERTLKRYLKYLEDAGLIMQLNKADSGLSQLVKPEKIYLNNTVQMYALSLHVNCGTLREIFFANMLKSRHEITAPKKADFLVEKKYLFEIGGKKKGFEQIKNAKNAFLVLDGIEVGFRNKIPLWLFGFLY